MARLPVLQVAGGTVTCTDQWSGPDMYSDACFSAQSNQRIVYFLNGINGRYIPSTESMCRAELELTCTAVCIPSTESTDSAFHQQNQRAVHSINRINGQFIPSTESMCKAEHELTQTSMCTSQQNQCSVYVPNRPSVAPYLSQTVNRINVQCMSPTDPV